MVGKIIILIGKIIILISFTNYLIKLKLSNYYII
jgi:hypothetical protein